MCGGQRDVWLCVKVMVRRARLHGTYCCVDRNTGRSPRKMSLRFEQAPRTTGERLGSPGKVVCRESVISGHGLANFNKAVRPRSVTGHRFWINVITEKCNFSTFILKIGQTKYRVSFALLVRCLWTNFKRFWLQRPGTWSRFCREHFKEIKNVFFPINNPDQLKIERF